MLGSDERMVVVAHQAIRVHRDPVVACRVGEQRELTNDCLTGAWVKTVTPIDFVLPQPRADGRTATISPGDLDEAIQTAILIGDPGGDDDVLGSAFEKIASFRSGVLDGLDPCLARL